LTPEEQLRANFIHPLEQIRNAMTFEINYKVEFGRLAYEPDQMWMRISSQHVRVHMNNFRNFLDDMKEHVEMEKPLIIELPHLSEAEKFDYKYQDNTEYLKALEIHLLQRLERCLRNSIEVDLAKEGLKYKRELWHINFTKIEN
jgi:hypothetical protein